MKNARTNEVETSVTGNGALILARFPVRCNTVIAEVLARLLRYERLTGLDAVFDASTTRLAAVVHSLQDAYGWTIERKDKATGCNDGRVAWVSEYYIEPGAVAAAMEGEAAHWCASVWRERTALRAKAAEAKRKAERLNLALKLNRPPLEQGALFGVANG